MNVTLMNSVREQVCISHMHTGGWMALFGCIHFNSRWVLLCSKSDVNSLNILCFSKTTDHSDFTRWTKQQMYSLALPHPQLRYNFVRFSLREMQVTSLFL